jgi:hypothetical protein
MTVFEERFRFLEDAFYELSLSGEKPDAKVLDELVRRYPEHADALTAFAIDLALDPTVADDEESGDDSPDVAVSRAMSRYQNRLYSIRQEDQALRRPNTSVANPFSALDRDGFRAVAHRLKVNSVFLQKMRDRLIDHSTIPRVFCERLTAELGSTPDVVAAHLGAPPQISPAAYYKAEQKPEVGSKQTFEQAVRSSGLTAERQSYLLSL